MSVVLEQKKRLYGLEMDKQYSGAVFGMEQKFNQFMAEVETRPADYMSLEDDWNAYSKQVYSDATKNITIPEAKTEFDKFYQRTERQRRFEIGKRARLLAIGEAEKQFVAEADAWESTGDAEMVTDVYRRLQEHGLRTPEGAKAELGARLHNIVGNKYYAQADAVTRANPTEAGVDAGAAWMASPQNTPAWTDEERNNRIGEFKRIWAARLAGAREASSERAFQSYLMLRKEFRAGRVPLEKLYDYEYLQKAFPGINKDDVRTFLNEYDREIETSEKAAREKAYNLRLDEAFKAVEAKTITREDIIAQFDDADQKALLAKLEGAAENVDYDRLRVMDRDDTLNAAAIDAAKALTPQQREHFEQRLREKEERKKKEREKRDTDGAALAELALGLIDPSIDYPAYREKNRRYLIEEKITAAQWEHFDKEKKTNQIAASPGASAALSQVRGTMNYMAQTAAANGNLDEASRLYGESGRLQAILTQDFATGKYDDENLLRRAKELLAPYINRGLFGTGLFKPPLEPAIPRPPVGQGQPPVPRAPLTEKEVFADSFKKRFGGFASHVEQSGVHMFRGADGSIHRTRDGVTFEKLDGKVWTRE